MHNPIAVQLGDPVGARVGNVGEKDQRVGLAGTEGGDQGADPVPQQVVAEVHHERRARQVVLGRQGRVGEPGRLVLDDVGDRRAEGGAVPDGLADVPPVEGAITIPRSVTPASTSDSMP